MSKPMLYKKNISTTQLASICGVSQGTVDRALNNRKGISEATRERILETAKAYGYRPNIHARSIAGGKSMLIGVVVFDLQNQYFSDILTMTEECCTEKGDSTVVMFTDKSPEKEIECIKNLYNMSVDGIVLCPINRGEEFENFLLSFDIPIVTIGNSLNRIPYIGIDNAQSMTDTVQYVHRKGYDAVVYVMPNLHITDNSFAQSERMDAFIKTAEAEGLQYIISDVATAINAIIPGKRTALICPTDIYAIRLFASAKEKCAGIIGFDNTRLIDWLNIPLDSVSYDVRTTAAAVVDYINSGVLRTQPISHCIVDRGSI